MIVLQTDGIGKSFADRTILANISIEVKLGERVALVGRNGAGKSTLLKIIAGRMSADSGKVILPKDRTMGYLPQNATMNSSRGIFDELLTVFHGLTKMEKKLRTMEAQMADPDRLADQAQYQELLAAYDRLQTTFKAKGGYTYRADIRSVLSGLGFGGFPETMPVSNLSGGQKTQLALGKLLLTKPDLLILDEPTNHLDIRTLTWLEDYLQRYRGSVLVVSHDRYFLDKVATKIYEIADHRVHKYDGNYSRYLALRAAAYESAMKSYSKQQKEIARMTDFIKRNIVRASTTKRAQSRRKQLAKMHMMEKPRIDEKSAAFSFRIEKESGRDVLTARNLSVGYEKERPLIAGLNFRIMRGERVALVGPNGVGKSTLLKAVAGGSTRLCGDVRLGSQVTIGYYDQEQAGLDPTKTVLNELWDDYPLKPENEIRNILGGFLFSGDDVKKTVAQLSGGEKARLELAKLMMRRDNLLILDEPTNHLDLDSKEVLEAALTGYPGTILFVSHDRYFINAVASRLFELSRQGMTEYLGDYDYYVDKKNEQRQLAELEARQTSKQPEQEKEPPDGKAHFLQDKQQKKEKRRLIRSNKQLETQIGELEKQIGQSEQSLLRPDTYNNPQKARDIQTEIDSRRKQLDRLMEQWSDLQERLEELPD